MKKFCLLASVLLLCAAPVFAQTFSFQGFEVDNSSWDIFGGAFNATRVASGSNGVTSKTGSFHAEAAGSGSGGTSASSAATNWGGYSCVAGCASTTCAAGGIFPPAGYITAVDVYLNLGATSTNDTRFDFSSAINQPSGAHRRDFVFNGGFYNDTDVTGSGPRFVISASNNAGRSNSFPKNPGRDPFAVTTTGWHTFQHKFYDSGGVLAVELSIINSSGTTIKTWTLSDPTDIIGSTVGGNRYGWFANNEFSFLAIDNSTLLKISTVKPFVFLANKITLEETKQVPSYGDMHSNGTLFIENGEPSTYNSKLTAVGNITIGKYNTINGDVTSQTNISNSGTINGTTSIGAVDVEPLPSLSYSAGGPNKTVPSGGALTLAPGSYGRVTMSNNGTLKLTSGEYFMNQLRYSSTIEGGVIEIDLSSGDPITINVVGNLQLGHEAAIVLLPNGESDSKLVTFNTLQTTNANWGREAFLLGSFNAPNAKVTLVKNTQLRGSICAKEIFVSNDCLFLHHDSPGSLPGPGNLPKPSEEVVSGQLAVVRDYALEQNYPNPFNPTTTISFALPQAGEVSLVIYNTSGQLVRKLIAGEMNVGRHSFTWDAKNERDERVASGVYLYVLKVGEFTAQRKLLLMK